MAVTCTEYLTNVKWVSRYGFEFLFFFFLRLKFPFLLIEDGSLVLRVS
jgi:hypothetical protein